MITITADTVFGRVNSAGGPEQLDRDILAAAEILGGPTSSSEVAADWLRSVYADVIRTAGSVDLQVPALAAIEVAA